MNKQGTPDTNTGVTTASLATTATPAVPLFRVFLIFMLIAGFPGLFAQDQKEIEKYFKMDIRELLQVDIVTAGKTVEKIAEIPAAVVLVTREDIENYGYSSLVELLENIPGLYCTKDYGYVNFGVRGFWTEASNRNMIILVNGVSQVDHRMSAYYIRQINVPVESIDRIEVIKGPMSVIYGSGAFFGVINIITNEMVTEKKDTPGLLSVSTGTAKTGKLFARLSGIEGEFRYVFNASHYGSYGLDVAYEALGYPSELSSGGRLEKKDTYFNVSASLREFSFDVSYTANRNESMFAFPAVLDGSDSFESATRLSFKYKKRFSGVFTLEAKLKYYDVKITDKYDSLFEGYFAVQDESSAAFEVEANLFITPVGGFNITVGLNYLNVFEVLNSFDVPFFGAANRRNILDKGNAIE
ncbi:MAG: TonB-dependent receptor plug domain-containing protein, partial [bacterium]|nr:TonB-dependent receptor plug domain-containing protein [bacterium]